MVNAMSLARRAGWNVIDQVMSALSNMLLMVFVAQALNDASGFGAFSMAFVVYGVAVAVAKAMVGQPLQMRHSADSPDAFRSAVRTSQGTAAWIGVVGGLICVAVAAYVGGPVGAAFFALAPCLPALVLQDSCRMAFFAAGRAEHAALIDFIRMVLQFGLLFGAIALGWTSVGVLTLTWGIAGLVSAAVGLYLLRAAPGLLSSGAWIREQKDITGYLIAEYILGLGAAQFGILMIAPLASAADVGAIRAVQTLLGPLNVLGTAALAFAVPELSRRAQMRAPARIKAMLAVSAAMGLVSSAYVVTLILLPDPVGQWLFRDSWQGAAPVLLPMGLNSIASSLGLGAAVTLYGMGLARKTFHLNILRAPVLLGLMAVGTIQMGAVGAALALAVVEALFLPFWLVTAIRSSRRHDRERDEAAHPAADPVGEPRS
ncbi:hypothetical protein GCM10025883_42560 [Mobilicoccus caccae]|uniref:Membrane protein involved in the export of O-antigen and teichoic acid n=2 Tax=Mobilicoccus caccae TaxID=1859295 RepID=A0ABQ6IYQ8_9MICO|nr:hypothetical protein GCM10025883_42560 [Mobilicoccus caccae]